MKRVSKQDRLFIKYLEQGLSQAKAYRKAFPGRNPKSAAKFASRKIRKQKSLQPIIENLSKKYKEDAEEAYILQKKLMRKSKTDPSLRNKIADTIQNRAGYSPVQKRMNISAHLDNPLLDKSSEELKKLFEDNAHKIKLLEEQQEKLKDSPSSR